VNELHLFAGAGGGILGSELLGIRTVCAVELEPYPSSVLLARQNDGLLPPFPIWDDVCTFDGRPWRGIVDVVSGGFPCQDISAAGKGAGIDGARSGLWREMHRIVSEVRPQYVFVENSPMLTSRGLGCVLGDMAAIGYDAEWMVLGADDVGAPHVRKRIWILAHDPHANGLQRPKQGEPFTGPQVIAGCSLHRDDVANSSRWQDRGGDPASQRFPSGSINSLGQSTPQPESERSDFKIPDANRQLRRPGNQQENREEIDNCGFTVSNTPHPGHVRGKRLFPENERLGSQGNYHDGRAETNDCGEWWAAEPDVGRVAHGLAARVDRLKALGNGQVPAVAATAFRVFLGRIQDGKEGK